MAIIPINNETEYALTETMMAEILRDAHDYFGSDVRLIRVQDGLQRHALNARTREVRYAFSPQDFGLGMASPSLPLPTESALSPTVGRRTRRRTAAALEPFEDSTEDEALVSHEVSLEHLEIGRDDDDDDAPYRAADHAEVESFLEPAEEDEENDEDVEEEAPLY